MRKDLTPPPEWETGRPSSVDYMDLNLLSTRHLHADQPRVVVFQSDRHAPLNPRGLLVAYEESGKVLPVVSDFDALLFGSRSRFGSRLDHREPHMRAPQS